MKIVYDKNFAATFKIILNYIAQDSQNSANRFKQELKLEIENIPNFPYKCRKSIWFNSENNRDLIFKGYTIPYLIQEETIIILDIFKWNKS